MGEAINATPIEALAYTYQRFAKFNLQPKSIETTPRRTRRRRIVEDPE